MGGVKRAPEVQPGPCSCSVGPSRGLGRRLHGDRPSCCHCPPCPALGGQESRASPLSWMQLQGRSGVEGTPSLACCRGDQAQGIVSCSSYRITAVPHSCLRGDRGPRPAVRSGAGSLCLPPEPCERGIRGPTPWALGSLFSTSF